MANVKNRSWLLAFPVIAAGLLGPAAHAAPVSYTMTFDGSGTLGGSGFTNAAITLTTVADTSTIYTLPGPIPFLGNPGTTTISIAGIGTATFNGGDQFGAFAEDLGAYDPGTEVLGLADLTLHAGSPTALAAVFHGYATSPDGLSATATLSGLLIPAGVTFPTTSGVLDLTPVSANATFDVASAAASVPEPASMSLLGIGAVAAFAARRRRQRV